MKELTQIQKRMIEQCNRMIEYNKKMIQRCIDEPNRLSSEAGILTPLKALKERHVKAVKNWQNAKRKYLRDWKKLGFDVSRLR